jgi:hypothetical protein
MMCPTPVQPFVQPLSLVVSNPLSNPRPNVSLSTPHTPLGLVRPFGRAHTLKTWPPPWRNPQFCPIAPKLTNNIPRAKNDSF